MRLTNDKKQKSTWARIIKKVYSTDSLVCPCCGSEMKIITFIFDPDEVRKILRHLINVGRSPPNFDPSTLN